MSDKLLRKALSTDETSLPSPEQLKNKIIIKVNVILYVLIILKIE